MEKDLKSLFKKLRRAYNDDFPKSFASIFNYAKQKMKDNRAYLNLCELLIFTITKIPKQFFAPSQAAEEAVEMAEADGNKEMAAIFHFLAGKALWRNRYYYNDYYDKEDRQKAEKHYRMALADPSYLASVSTNNFPWLKNIRKSFKTYDIFGKNLLAFIALETERYDVLYDYFKNTDNRMAICLALIMKTTQKFDGAVHTKEEQYKQLMEIIRNYPDLSVICLAVDYIYKHDLLPHPELSEKADELEKENAIAEQKYLFVKEYADRFADDKNFNKLKAHLIEMKEAYFGTTDIEQVAVPDTSFSMQMKTRNIGKMTLSVYLTDFTGMNIGNENWLDESYNTLLDMHLHKQPVYSKTYELDNSKPYITLQQTIEVKPLPKGIYLIVLESDKKQKDRNFLYVTDITAIQERLPEKKIRIAVLNSTTGHPIPYAKIDFYSVIDNWSERKIKKIKTLSCNKEGEVIYDSLKNSNKIVYFPYTDKDKFSKQEEINKYEGMYGYTDERNEEKTEILTDRGIYRPGQTIHAAFVRYRVDKQKNITPIKGKGSISLKNEKGYLICSANIEFDDFGVAHFDFQIPEDADSGRYSLRCGNESMSVRVEQYKRPTFEVKIEPYKQPFKVGDTLKVEGTACSYAGVPIANVTVKYRVKRAMAWWWRFWSPYWETSGQLGHYGEGQFHEGETTTDDQGHFVMDVPMLLDDSSQDNSSRPLFMDIIAEADVVDTTGEVQTERISLPLSNREYIMRIEMKEQIELSEQPSFTILTKNASGQDHNMDVSYWIDNAEERQSVSSNQMVKLPALTVGKHVLNVSDGKEVLTHEFYVFDKYATQTPFTTEKWSYQSANEFPKNGDEVILQVGCSKPDAYILYNVFSGNDLVECGAEYAESGMINRRMTYKNEYGNGVLVSFAWVKDRKMQTANFVIRKPIPERKLKMEWTSFRDKLTPGSSDCWRLKIKDMQGRNVTANVIAKLYDKSIDQLLKDEWFMFDEWLTFGPHLSWNMPSVNWTCGDIPTISFGRFIFPHNWGLGLPEFFTESLCCLKRHECSVYGEDDWDSDFEKNELSLKEDLCCRPCAPSNNTGDDYESKKSEINLRTDMSETAFFMPVLRTDDNGEVMMEFVLPDSLTTWKFKAVAHTKDFHVGFFEDEAVARKLVMVQPYLPRFVRVGDETNISAKVTNASGKQISGKMVYELLNAENGKLVWSGSRNFTLEDNESKAESFQFTPDEEVSDYICKIYAVGDGFSDGEQHQLPVLPNKTEVTVTTIITQDGPGTETVNTAVMFPENTTRRKLSLQYTNHPMWLAIKALPAMTDDNSENAISLAVSLYCNLLTDWLQKSVREFGQIQEIDKQTLMKSTKKIIKKLESLQGGDGGFSWFKNMPQSLYMTTEVAMHLCRLTKLTGWDNGVQTILDKAMAFCDKGMCEEVKWLKELEKKGEKVFMPTFTMLQHMYNCAVINHTLNGKAKEAFDYLIPLLKKDIHEQTIREKAMSAMILDYAGDHDRALTYVESLRQYTECDNLRGRTFQTPRASYSWFSYKIPTHVSGMEALHLLCPDDRTTLMEMQKWLLNEKRTQMWETPLDSVNAVHALLLDVNPSIMSGEPTKFFADSVPVDVTERNNEGYVETELPSDTVRLDAEKSSDGMSWGAVFAKFLQPMAEVEASGSGMTIQREIITDKSELHVGDRITVRLTYHCDRNYDFVTVTDSKAACMEPVEQLSWSDSFKHVTPLDTETRYSYYGLAEGTYSIETEYYLTRPGVYEIGIATIVCTYAPEFRASCPSQKLIVKS